MPSVSSGIRDNHAAESEPDFCPSPAHHLGLPKGNIPNKSPISPKWIYFQKGTTRFLTPLPFDKNRIGNHHSGMTMGRGGV